MNTGCRYLSGPALDDNGSNQLQTMPADAWETEIELRVCAIGGGVILRATVNEGLDERFLTGFYQSRGGPDQCP